MEFMCGIWIKKYVVCDYECKMVIVVKVMIRDDVIYEYGKIFFFFVENCVYFWIGEEVIVFL